MDEVEFGLGEMVVDRITGFKGVIIATHLTLESEPSYRVQSRTLSADGHMIDTWITESRLENVKED